MNFSTSAQGFVYVIAETGTNYVKIGFSENPAQRLSGLQVGNPRRLSILALYPGCDVHEKACHLAFSDYASGGEWFDLPSGALERIPEIISNVKPRHYARRPARVSYKTLADAAFDYNLRSWRLEFYRDKKGEWVAKRVLRFVHPRICRVAGFAPEHIATSKTLRKGKGRSLASRRAAHRKNRIFAVDEAVTELA